MVEHYLFKMFHWYLLVGNFVICFWSRKLLLIICFWLDLPVLGQCCLVFQLVLILTLIFGWTLSVQDVLTWSACFGSIVFICYVVSAGSSSQLVLILSLIFGWILSVQDVSLISFGRKFCNLFLDQFGFEIAFDTCSVFDLICLFWVNSVYLLCCFSRKFFSIGIDIKFDIWLNIICSRCFIDIVW